MNAALHDAYAGDYDRQVRIYGSYIHEALFGLCFEYIQPGQRLLDLGIGTGLAAWPFAASGLLVHGIDFSSAMIDLCRDKGFAVELVQQDLQVTPWPVQSGFYDIALSCGVFHFIPELEVILSETRRVLKNEALFAFTTKSPSILTPENARFELQSISGMDIFAHSRGYIESLLQDKGFQVLKSMRCFVGDDLFQTWVAGHK